MAWKTRTHTKILILGLIWIGILVSAVTIGNVFKYRENSAPIITALTIGGAGMFLTNIIRTLKEKKSDLVDPAPEKKEGSD
jgi:hypothetical protein